MLEQDRSLVIPASHGAAHLPPLGILEQKALANPNPNPNPNPKQKTLAAVVGALANDAGRGTTVALKHSIEASLADQP